jgi:hypothetical protein
VDFPFLDPEHFRKLHVQGEVGPPVMARLSGTRRGTRFPAVVEG